MPDAALEAPDDDLKVLVMECLEEVPIDNLQTQEVANIVSIIADCDNLTVGRTEEILSHTFAILTKLAVDDGEDAAEAEARDAALATHVPLIPAAAVQGSSKRSAVRTCVR